MAIVERLILVGFGLCLAFCLLFSWLAWLFTETIAKGFFQVATIGFMVGAPVVWFGNLRYQSRKREISLKKAKREARFKLFSGTANTIAVDMTGRQPGFHQYAIAPNGSRATGTAQPLPVAQEPMTQIEFQQPLLPVLLSMDRLLIIGGMGAGKSELLRHLAFQRSQQGETVIIDSHSAPDDWPESCRVVGRGRQYRQIESEVGRIMGEMDRRYKLHSAGHGGAFQPLTLVVDELTVLNQFTDISDQLKALLCECRKVSIRLVFAGQSDRAGALGLRGNYDLKSGFEALVYLEQESTGERIATVQRGTDKQGRRFLHPGPFAGCPGYPSRPGVSPQNPHCRAETGGIRGGTARRDTDMGQLIEHNPGPSYAQFTEPDQRRFFESRFEKQVVELAESGASMRAIAKEAFGFTNGRKISEVKAILTKHGIEA